MKLKIGQKFKVVDEWNEEAKNFINWDGEMDKWLGKVLTVREYSCTRKIYFAKEDENENEKIGWIWHDCMIDWKATNKLNGVDE